MNAEIYAEWLRRQGERVLHTASAYWHTAGYGVYQAFPYHWLITPSQIELSVMFLQHRALALRYCMPPDCAEGCPSYSIIFEGGKYDLEGLGYRTRKNVRRGLRSCSVEPISFQRLVDEGWDLRLDALDRQGRRLKITGEAWRKRYLSAADLPGFRAWGALVQDRLAGYIVTFQMGDCICIIDQQSHRDYLSLNINNAMTFVVSENAVVQPSIRLVFYGHESLDAPPRVSDFKFHMGYVAKPVRQRVTFHPYLSSLINPMSYQIVKRMASWRPGNRELSKAEGMLRFCLAEKNPINAESASRSETIA